MKGVFIKLILLIVGIGIVVYLAQPVSPCDTPIKYQLGQVDSRFNLSRSEAAKNVNEASQIWSEIYGKNIFIEDNSAKLTVNFVFDERQALTNQINFLENQVGTDRASLDARIAAFKKEAADFQAKVADLNNQIESWNSKGGAPPDVYQSLKSQQQALRDEAARLQQEANSLNLSTRDFNFQVGQLNSTINTFNGVLAQKPEEGLYDGRNQTISIYFDNSRPELVHTLAHEFGHVLGMYHVDDKNAIMYAFTSESTKPTTADVTDLTQACQKIPRFQELKNNLVRLIQETKLYNGAI